MAKRYTVDLRSLSPAEREAAFELMDSFSFQASCVFGKSGLEGAVVVWDRQEDFPTSPVFPNGCTFREN